MIGLLKRTKPQAVSPRFQNVADAYLKDLVAVRGMLKLGSPIKEQGRRLKETYRHLSRVVAAFEAGFEPATPPAHWFAGRVRRWNHTSLQGMWRSCECRLLSRFPSKNPCWWTNHDCQDVPDGRACNPVEMTFRGVLPVEVQTAYLKAEKVFGEALLVYSPKREDFMVTSLRQDPVLIGALPEPLRDDLIFFEVARWDTSGDLTQSD